MGNVDDHLTHRGELERWNHGWRPRLHLESSRAVEKVVYARRGRDGGSFNVVMFKLRCAYMNGSELGTEEGSHG